jgi:hypothetical protein
MLHREHFLPHRRPYSARSKVVDITREGFQSEDLMTPMEATISEAPTITPRADKRATYCHQQAAECALAATTVVSGEIKEAYLNIERAWLQLAPEIDSRRKGRAPVLAT